MNFDFSKIGPLALAILLLFLIYRRFRRNFGQQPLRPVRMRVRSGLLLVIGCLLLPSALRSAAFLSAMLGGTAAGVALAMWGCYYSIVLRKSKRVVAEEVSLSAPLAGES